MFQPDQYQLLDFGNGEKLEAFDGTIVRRSTPSIDPATAKSADCDWESQLRFQIPPTPGTWIGTPPKTWRVRHRALAFLLKPTPAGQLGIFPEQASNWEWIDNLSFDLSGLSALNLFGYTGGTTMALAARGATVVHVDAARNVVKWARANAAAAGIKDFPIRWIVEDALKFLTREAKRGSRYDILIADPPTYGKGPHNESWKMVEQFELLLPAMAAVAAPRLRVLILSCHTPGFNETVLQQTASRYFDFRSGSIEALPLAIKSSMNRSLNCGHCLRFASEP